VSDEPKRIIMLGVVEVREGEVIAFDIPPDLGADAIKAALAAAESERAAETQKLRTIFLPKEDGHADDE
jgi:hypothetical protein